MIDSQIDPLKTALLQYGGIGSQSVEAATGHESPQLVIVSVPTSLHLKVLMEVSKKWSPSTYLIEKPFGSSSEEARRMAEILKIQGAKVYVNYLRRYLPNFISLKSSPLFFKRGRLLSVTINGYGTLENIFSHFFDLLVYLETSSTLGLSKKIKHSTSIGNLNFRDSDTGINFELNGVRQGFRDCEMTLVYDSIVIEMSSNGRCIEVVDRQGTKIATFNTDPSVFDAYQEIILSRIAEEFKLKEKNTSVEDAIRLHEFIESI